MALLDDFNRADENPIASPWVSVTGTPNCQVISNAFASTGAYGAAYYTLFQAQDIDIQCTLSVMESSTNDGVYFHFRTQNPTADTTKNGYVAVLAGTGSTSTTVYVLNTGPSFGTAVIQNTTTWASGDICRITALGAQITIYKNGVSVGTGSNSERIQGGYILLQAQTSGYRLDDLNATILAQQTYPFDAIPFMSNQRI